MSWLLWRQHRRQGAITAMVVALFGFAVLLTGRHMANIYRHAVRTCPSNGACDLVGQLFKGYGAIIDAVHLSDTLPVLLGVFLGAVLVAREAEQATNVLVWTQTVTRRRWMGEKVALAVGATIMISGVVAVLVTWWSGTPNSLYGNRFEGAQFDTQNIAPIAFALFAVGLGIAAGAFLRRTLPAIAATVGGYAAVRLLVSLYLRPHFQPAVSQNVAFNNARQLPSGTWMLDTHLVDAAGHAVSSQLQIPSACFGAADRSGVTSCLGRLGYHSVVTFQPASRYWTFQWMESGLYLVLAAGLIAGAVLYTLRRDA